MLQQKNRVIISNEEVRLEKKLCDNHKPDINEIRQMELVRIAICKVLSESGRLMNKKC